MPLATLQARAQLAEVTFEIYAYRALTEQEAKLAIAAYMVEHPEGFVQGVTYTIFSNIGRDDDEPAKAEIAT